MTLVSLGSWTITASDQTDPGKTSAVSPPITTDSGSFSKLLVLLPGETAAPGTLNGKTGSPAPQGAGTPFNVTVYATDSNWSPVSSVTDVIRITSSDTSAVLPADAALIGGTGYFPVMMSTAETWTVTASDQSTAGIAAATSSEITVAPDSLDH